MNKLDCGEVTIAILATPKKPAEETGGAEVFTGALANALVEQGFPVRVYGQENPSLQFAEDVTYVATGPGSDEIMERDGVGLRKAIHVTGVVPSLMLAADIAVSPETQKWAIIDNDTVSAPLAPLLAHKVPHLFVQHSRMNTHLYDIYEKVRSSGGKVIAIADHQRENTTANFGSLHDTTIKNGISIQDFDGLCPRPYEPGEPIRIGTLSRIDPADIKGVRLAARAVQKLRERHDASLTIAGPTLGEALDTVVAPHLSEHVSYVGPKRGKEKVAYIADMHVGAALSNPGGWNQQQQQFTSRFVEGNSLALHEMICGGAIPVSTDSGGAEPMKDAGLHDFIVPLDTIRQEGMDTFIEQAAYTILKAAYARAELPDIRSRVRTATDMGRDYGEYILSLIAR